MAQRIYIQRLAVFTVSNACVRRRYMLHLLKCPFTGRLSRRGGMADTGDLKSPPSNGV